MITQNINSQLIENPNVHIKDKLFNIQYFLNLLYTSNCSCIFHKFDSHYNFTKINYLPLPLLVYKQKPFQDYET